jgi:tetraacyldisaccharide 4'-kinase
MSAITRALSTVFDAAVRARSAAYDSGLRAAREVGGLRVVSVGGVRAGGDGKTPLALHCALELHRAGLAVAILCRGYRGRWERRGGVVADGGGGAITATVEDVGDEALMLARRAPGIVVVVGADRVAAAERARALGAQVVVLDSGFQHRRLARDLDIVSVSLPLRADERALPAGPLREPLAALARADLVGFEVTVGAEVPLLAHRCFAFRLKPTCLVDAAGSVCADLSELAGARALVVCGIARPDRFIRVAEALGAKLVGRFVFRDHHAFTARDRASLIDAARAARAEVVLTTEKDATRLGPLGGPAVRALRVEVVIESEPDTLSAALAKLA